jgi:uncharacterized membrane protein
VREWFVAVSESAITVLDAIALLAIALGTVEVIVRIAHAYLFMNADMRELRDAWIRYARWLVAALTFQLAADLVETSISTSWVTVGRVGAIAVIRTFLEYFLDRDLTEIRRRQREPAVSEPPG